MISSTHDVIILCKSFFDFLLLIALSMSKIVPGDCGHIKAQWDNHHSCLKCSSCSRLSTCCTCSTWSEETWILADKCCMYASKKSQDRDRARRKDWLSFQIYLMTIQLMAAPPHRAILPGVGPIKVAATRMLNAAKV